MFISTAPQTLQSVMNLGNTTTTNISLDNAKIISTSGNPITLLPTGSAITIIGDAGATSRGLNTNDDFFISGKLEVDGIAYFDGAVYYSSYCTLLDNQPLYLGSSTDSMIMWNALQTPDSLMLALGSDSNGLVITTKANTGYDFAHALQTNPTLFIHSATQSTTQWTGITHNQTDTLITSGVGDIFLNPAGLVKFGTHTALSGESVSGYITINDAGGTPRKLAVVS